MQIGAENLYCEHLYRQKSCLFNRLKHITFFWDSSEGVRFGSHRVYAAQSLQGSREAGTARRAELKEDSGIPGPARGRNGRRGFGRGHQPTVREPCPRRAPTSRKRSHAVAASYTAAGLWPGRENLAAAARRNERRTSNIER